MSEGSSVVDWKALRRCEAPFLHWVGPGFIQADLVREINEGWPAQADWTVEKGAYTRKSALMFPRRLHEPAQALARHLYAPEAVNILAAMTGVALVPDPWFEDGPMVPRVGGGLHEIFRDGLLKVHVDFNRHPTGLTRALNLLVYLTPDWKDQWGGHLELHGKSVARIAPQGGTVAIFETGPKSWHGHPEPLKCPADVTRRSLALYYYTRSAPADRKTTVYR